MKLTLKTAKVFVECWEHNTSLGTAVCAACGVTLGDEVDWRVSLESLGINKHASVKQGIRQWIATHFVKANEELWRKHPNKAMKWMISDLDYGASTRPVARAVGEFKQSAGYKTIRMRDLSKKHDWNTCK